MFICYWYYLLHKNTSYILQIWGLSFSLLSMSEILFILEIDSLSYLWQMFMLILQFCLVF